MGQGHSETIKRILVTGFTTLAVLLAGGCVSAPSPTPTGTGNLQILVKDTDGNALGGAKVVSSVQPEGQLSVNGITSEPDGTVIFAGIKAGDYRFSISRFDYSPREISVTVVANQTVTVYVYMTSSIVYSQYELEYRLLSRFDNVFWCDPDFYPVGRPGQEQQNALAQFATIRANAAEFAAILQHLGLPDKTDYTDQEKLLIYREHKRLTYAVQMTASDGGYDFVLRVGEGQGYRIEGKISSRGEVTVLKQEPSINTCPICLAKGSLIDAPDGPIPVEQLRIGMAVWTVDASGKRVAAGIVQTAVTPVPPSFQMVRIKLSDGRTVTASPGHPSATGRALGDYRINDTLDGAVVAAVDSINYDGGATYDILPSGSTGLYWVNGVLLKSTLTGK